MVDSSDETDISKIKTIIEQLKIEIMVREEELMDYKEILNKKEQEMIKVCSKIGHNFQREVEDGPYGETFYTCKICGFTTL